MGNNRHDVVVVVTAMGDGSSTPRRSEPDAFDEKSSPAASAEAPGDASLTDYDQTASDRGESSSVGQVSRYDQAELDAHPPRTGAISTDAPTPAEFASQAFADGVQSRAVRAGMDGHSAVPLDADADVIGSWQAYTIGDVTASSALEETDSGETGRTFAFMQQETLSESDDRAATKAYVTDYDHDSNRSFAPETVHAHSQMAVSAGLDAMGVRGPQHAYDTVNDRVAAESVVRNGYDADYASPDELRSEYANRVRGEQMKDIFAANLIMGNGDLSADNVMIGEDGAVIPFDYDFTQTKPTTAEVSVQWGRTIDYTIDAINEQRDEPLNIDQNDVLDRTVELARQLKHSGAVERVAAAAKQYDDYFIDEQGHIGDQISARVEVHVEGYSQEPI